MKKHLLWSLAALPLLASCASDEPTPDSSGNLDNVEGVYMTVNFNSPQVRSYTNGDNSSNDGIEYGSNEENEVNSVLLVLAEPETHKYISSSTIDKGKLNPMTAGNQTVYQATAKFSKTDIASFYGPGIENHDVNVFVYCNPTAAIKLAFEIMQPGNTTWTNNVCKIASVIDGENAIWNKKDGFLMSNVSMETRSLPSTMDEWNAYTTEATAFDLSGVNNSGQLTEVDNLTNRGSISVHRAAARFDFRDGSQMDVKDGNGVKGSPFTYDVVMNSENKSIVQIRLVSMGLVNMLNSEYYLERVSNDGLDANATLLGAEKPWFTSANGVETLKGNYVVSPYADLKESGITKNFSQYFINSMFDDNGNLKSRGNGWGTFSILDDIVKGTQDNYGNNEYYIWRYCTENTIPGAPANQTNGISTGIVFKGRMQATENLATTDKWGKLLSDALNGVTDLSTSDAPVIYSLAGNLYITWPNVQEAALAAAGFDATKGQNQNLDRSSTLYMACFGNGGVGTIRNDEGQVIYTDTEIPDENSANYNWLQWNENRSDAQLLAAYRKAVTGANFTIYQPSQDEQFGWGYYCYYYYWNRHNDNGIAGSMGRMEFGVVRNNVYKLAVTRLKTLGHPRTPENDPDSPDPDDPDETSDLYMTVSLKVVPWVVRINNIEF